MNIHKETTPKKIKIENFIFLICLVLGMLVLFHENILVIQGNQQFVDLAISFTQGKLYFPPTSGYIYDSAFFKGYFFWPLGPLPSIILMPFTAIFGQTVKQGSLQFVLIMVIFFLNFKIAQRITGNTKSSLWLSFGYIFATAFIGLAILPFSWQFSQIIANVFIIYAIYEYLSKKRWLLIGICVGLAVATRIHLVLAAVFFGLSILAATTGKKEKLINLAKLILPIGFSIILLLLYNYLRFANIFEQGYSFQVVNSIFKAQAAYGIWSLNHIPANLYFFLFKGPEGIFVHDAVVLKYPFIAANPWGMSIIFTSPMLLWFVKAPLKNRDAKFALLTICILSIAIFGYYGIGWIQYGYRYAVDFYPFLFFMLALAVKQNPRLSLLKIIIVLTFFFNIYLTSFRQ